MRNMKNRLGSQCGAVMVENCIKIALIAVVCIISVNEVTHGIMKSNCEAVGGLDSREVQYNRNLRSCGTYIPLGALGGGFNYW